MDSFRLARPLLHRLAPETAHNLTLWALQAGLAGRDAAKDDPRLASRVLGLDFPSPLGLAAGFDKNAEAIGPLLDLGFGFVEVGSITPLPQRGNPKPRIFRLAEDRGVINRLGFNNQGLVAAADRLRIWCETRRPGIVGVNLGKNRTQQDAPADYAEGARRLAPYADYLAINVSSPNTPGLRALQQREELEAILQAVREAAPSLPPLLLKIAPDLSPEDLEAVCEVALAEKLDGLIIGNTTISRPESLRSAFKTETGGLSGAPLFALSTEVLRQAYRLTGGKLTLIGTGGVSSGEEAYAKIRAGASLVQLYSALVYQGPALIARIKRDLAELLTRDGFASVSEAVGSDNA
ncbi:MAG: quinone-dependent dihydroorotate dehydrogenase [Rhodovibrionaceae bacterium]